MSIYQQYDNDQVEELLSNYLIDSWSYSRVSTFARNEKEFEMRYLFGEVGKKSPAAVAGQAYHKALELYFQQIKAGETMNLAAMQQAAYDLIKSVPPKLWKLSKTRLSIEECISSATDVANKAIQNFLSEINTYLSEIKEVVSSELKLKSWLTINNVDIPLPCNLVIDLVIRTKDGKTVLIDHKLKSVFATEEEIKYTIGKQAITYVKGYESAFEDVTIDEFWVVENKHSKNKDGKPQLSLHKYTMDRSTRRLYEAMLYEPLSRMILAVSDSNYVYLINDSDNFVDKAEIYEFWAQTLLDKIEESNETKLKY